MSALGWAEGTWRKGSRSQFDGNCVEVAFSEEVVALRDSKSPHIPPLVITRAEFAAFVGLIKAGDFDRP